ncbi:Gfo/Idh/MocA family protein [Amycolatopsis echigonensis]|uniref:Dehydrogenase n=1 Tax=Amycolatopsis echigonensis TaxID=2576905 RepID=A0A2N3WU71_9PSEU|nr:MULTISPECIES: Gfo/Idh/MocA family oxidoreductase [Amycolatopsis]MBB2503513.1 Gfo/Idh/MocA family oxidoreductase [Amycolatopsis echigonensis]PKV97393.1 putative dehydrogenase [Amycolatopsis niigatensis]
MTKPIGVGILGASPDRSWAGRAHVPAIAASPDFSLVGVATTRSSTAEAARTRFGARHAFTAARSLAEHPDVDLVVVTVKVPAHVELVTAALEAGKHVYCEWPLTTTAEEAAALAAAGERAGVHTAVGLQARFSPSVSRARAMISAGEIGTVQSATVYSSRGKGNTRDVPGWTAYTYDRRAGAGLVEVLGGHTLDLVQYQLGPIRELTARTAIRNGSHRVAETGEPLEVTAPDHFLAHAELDSGAVVSVHLHDGDAAMPRTRIEIAGTAGNLALTSAPETDPWAAQPQIGWLDLQSSRPGSPEWTVVPVSEVSGLPVQAANVGRVYDLLAADLRDGTHTVPDFGVARRLHELLSIV